ncbi:MAG: hypothetical protein R3F34_11645 [Planctomycetota bacterium]
MHPPRTGPRWVSTASRAATVRRARRVYLFERRASGWEQLHYVKATNTNIEDGFRSDGRARPRSARGRDGRGAASGVDGDQSDNSAWFAGAAYLLDLDRWNVVHGCAPHTASLVPPDVGARIGSTVDVGIDAGLVVDGVAATYYGSKEPTSRGCGTPLTPVDERRSRCTFPVLHSFSSVVGGAGTVSLALPGAPGLAGIHVTLQSAIVDTATFATELTSGLEFRILP